MANNVSRQQTERRVIYDFQMTGAANDSIHETHRSVCVSPYHHHPPR